MKQKEHNEYNRDVYKEEGSWHRLETISDYMYMGTLLLCITYMYGIIKLLIKNVPL